MTGDFDEAQPDPSQPPEPPRPPEPALERRDRHGSVIDQRSTRRGPTLGQVIVGAFLILVGIGWFLEAADLADVPWGAVLPAALIVIGAALVFGSRTGRHGGIIALGVVLTVAVAAASAVEVLIDIPLTGGVGEETETVVGPIESEYRHAIGQMTVDLRAGRVAPSGQDVDISLGIGELIVIVPREVDVDVEARTGIGEVMVFDRTTSGLGPDLDYVTPDATAPVLRLNVDVAIGRLEVRR